jgi:hypothetical protein
MCPIYTNGILRICLEAERGETTDDWADEKQGRYQRIWEEFIN